MKIAIVDDLETDANLLHTQLKSYLATKNLISEIYLFKSGEEFLNFFSPHTFSLVFLDIYMKKLTGMDVAKTIYRQDKNCKIIFLTTSEEYSRQSYTVHAVYYLMKPINPKEFLQAMAFCHLTPQYDVPSLNVTSEWGPLELDTSQILYIDYKNRSCHIHLLTQTLIVKGTFKEIIAPLEEDVRFLLCIRGVLVNMQHITGLAHTSFILTNEENVPINIRHQKSITQSYHHYLINTMGGL